MTDPVPPQDPVPLEERARRQGEQLLARDEATRALGIRIDDVAPGRATATMTVRPVMVNGHGTCHGGYLFLLADTAFAFACNTHGAPVVAAGADIVFVAPAREGDVLAARGVERVRSGRSGIYDVTVTGRDGAVVAEFRGRSRQVGPQVTDR